MFRNSKHWWFWFWSRKTGEKILIKKTSKISSLPRMNINILSNVSLKLEFLIKWSCLADIIRNGKKESLILKETDLVLKILVLLLPLLQSLIPFSENIVLREQITFSNGKLNSWKGSLNPLSRLIRILWRLLFKWTSL